MTDKVIYNDPTANDFTLDYNESEVDERVLKRTKSIRHKMKGKDVREAIYQGVEIASVVSVEAKETSEKTEERQDKLEKRYEEQLAGNTDVSEVIDARDSESVDTPFPTLKARLDWMESEHYLDTHGSVTTTRTLIDDNFTMNHTVTKIGEVADPNDDNPIVIATIDDDKQNRFKLVKVGEI